MTRDAFQNEANKILARVLDILNKKGLEYTPDSNNRFSNFENAARILNTSPLKSWQGFWVKHLVSLFDIIENPTYFDESIVEEKIQDLIAYLVIFELMYKQYFVKPKE